MGRTRDPLGTGVDLFPAIGGRRRASLVVDAASQPPARDRPARRAATRTRAEAEANRTGA